MKKILLAGACALALSATGALAQTNEGQGSAPSAKSGGTMSPSGERHMKKEHKTTGSAMRKSGAKSQTGGQDTNEGGSGQH